MGWLTRLSLYVTSRRATEDGPPEVKKMEAESVELASVRQRRFIDTLTKQTGIRVEKRLDKLSTAEASKLIDQLLATANGSRTAKSATKDYWEKRGDDVRLGLATKCVYNHWIGNVCGITRSERIRQDFIKEVLETYNIFKEICRQAAEIKAGGEDNV